MGDFQGLCLFTRGKFKILKGGYTATRISGAPHYDRSWWHDTPCISLGGLRWGSTSLNIENTFRKKHLKYPHQPIYIYHNIHIIYTYYIYILYIHIIYTYCIYILYIHIIYTYCIYILFIHIININIYIYIYILYIYILYIYILYIYIWYLYI